MLEIKELTGGYVNIPVLKDVSFEVGNGQLVGLIGLNGAGKSTTINEIIGLLTPYKGQIQIDGLELRTNPSDYRKKIGFIPETPSLYEELTNFNIIWTYNFSCKFLLSCSSSWSWSWNRILLRFNIKLYKSQ